MHTTQYTDLQTKDLGNSEYEISATIPAEVVTTYREQAIQTLGADVEVPGFRKGNVPEDMLLGHLGESRVMEKAGNLALAAIYPTIIVSEKIDAIGSPQIHIKKLAKDNPLEFTATTAVMPAIQLSDYKKTAYDIFSTEETFEVTDKELEDTLTHVRRQRAHVEGYEQQKKDGVENPSVPEIKDDELPELTDEFVQTLGDFKTVADFEAKVRENILEEKKLRAKDKKRIATVEKIIADSKITLPQLLVDQELHRIQAQMEAEIAHTGTKLEDYLKNIDKTIENLREEWVPEAEKRAKLQLILNTISKNERIKPDAEEVQREVAHVLQHYPQAEEENVRMYVETTKRNEMVFTFLEEVGK
tara:strand:+ start:2101 stop:3177 length:1077 start_codon:yes stop_codon:yes gene_type:complete